MNNAAITLSSFNNYIFIKLEFFLVFLTHVLLSITNSAIGKHQWY